MHLKCQTDKKSYIDSTIIQRPWMTTITQIYKVCHYLTLNISETVKDRHSYNLNGMLISSYAQLNSINLNDLEWVIFNDMKHRATIQLVVKLLSFTSDKGGGKSVCPRLFVCLSINSNLARLLKNACMDLDEMLHVDRCLDLDKLINFWAWSGLCWNRIALSDIVCAATRNFTTSGKSHVYLLRPLSAAVWGFVGRCAGDAPRCPGLMT